MTNSGILLIPGNTLYHSTVEERCKAGRVQMFYNIKYVQNAQNEEAFFVHRCLWTLDGHAPR